MKTYSVESYTVIKKRYTVEAANAKEAEGMIESGGIEPAEIENDGFMEDEHTSTGCAIYAAEVED